MESGHEVSLTGTVVSVSPPTVTQPTVAVTNLTLPHQCVYPLHRETLGPISCSVPLQRPYFDFSCVHMAVSSVTKGGVTTPMAECWVTKAGRSHRKEWLCSSAVDKLLTIRNKNWQKLVSTKTVQNRLKLWFVTKNWQKLCWLKLSWVKQIVIHSTAIAKIGVNKLL